MRDHMGPDANELEALPTLSQGQTCDLKIETERRRVWLSRGGVEDGEPYARTVTVERLIGGRWITTGRYDGDA